MATSPIAFSNGAVKCKTVTPLIRDEAVFPKGALFSFSDIREGNLSLPELGSPALEVVAFVTHQAMQAYCTSSEVCRTADEYGLQMHLHKMMLFLATCCPTAVQEVLGAVEAVGYVSDSVMVEVTTPGSSPTASRTGAQQPGTAAGSPAAETEALAAAPSTAPLPTRGAHETAAAATGPEPAAAPGAGLTGSHVYSHKQGSDKQRSDKQHGTKLETEELIRAHPLAGRIEIVVRLVSTTCT